MRLDYFQLIDRIVEIDTAKATIRAEATVPAASTIFEGHFPGYPLMPGVLLIESMAQTAGWLVLALQKFEKMPFLVAVKQAKLRKFVTPGEILALSAERVHDGSGFAVVKALVAIDGKPACDAEITLSLAPFPNALFEREMRAQAERISMPSEIVSHA